MGDLSSKVALVTGASRGIGRAIAETLASDGALVIVHFGRNSKAAEEAVGVIASRGGTAFALQADLGAPQEIERFIVKLDEELNARTGNTQLDILVNNAGIASPASYREMSVEQFDHLFAVNVRGAFLMTQAAIRRMRRGGRIINISSLASRHAAPSAMVPPYSMTKAALDAFTLGLAQDLGAQGTTANTVAPGAIETDINAQLLRQPEIRKGIEAQTALRRIGEVKDIADVVRFLASSQSQWITGQYIAASGGFRL
jgi:3-oxoacyl-[acyl-carrier protein] reductase